MDDKKTCGEYGRRATPRRHAPNYCIEGEYFTMRTLAQRLGVSKDTAEMRLRKARKQEGPVTWEKLREVGTMPSSRKR